MSGFLAEQKRLKWVVQQINLVQHCIMRLMAALKTQRGLHQVRNLQRQANGLLNIHVIVVDLTILQIIILM